VRLTDGAEDGVVLAAATATATPATASVKLAAQKHKLADSMLELGGEKIPTRRRAIA